MFSSRPQQLLFLALVGTTIGVALAESTLQVTGHSPPVSEVTTRTAWSAPQGSIWAFSTQSDLASPANGLAQPAVTRDVIPGHESIHNPTFLNDGYYGNGSSWIGTGPDSWLKIDLGQTVPVSSVRFGRDRIGHFDDRDPGRFQIFLATTDDVYANGNDQNDSQEYQAVFDSESVGFSGEISGSQSLLASFTPTSARYVKVQFGNDGAAIDEVEVAAEGNVISTTTVEPPPEADACATAPCGEFALCTDLPGASTTAAGRSCACSSGYRDNGAGACFPADPVVLKIAADSKSSSTTSVLKSIAATWEQKTKGAVVTKTYSWSQLGTEEDVAKKMRLGQVQGAFLTTWGLFQLEPDLAALNIPGMVRNHDERDELLRKLGPTLEAALEAKGYVVLTWGELGPVHVFSTTARTTVSSLQQAKFASYGDSSWRSALVSWGLKPVTMTQAEVVSTLQTNIIDSFPWTAMAAYNNKTLTKARYMSDLVWSTMDQALVIEKKSWERLPSEWRSNLKKIAEGFGAKLPSGATEEASAIAKLQAQGLQVSPFTETAAWYALQEASYANNVRGKLVSTSVFDSAQKILADYRAAHPAK